MIGLRILRLVAHLLIGMAICAFIFPWSDDARRTGYIRRWSQRLLIICGVKVVVRNMDQGTVASRALIVANHVSWLDIFVVNSFAPCRFVAKSDIRSWPFIGWLCAKTGTIFIARSKISDVRRILRGLVSNIQAGERVAFFPEGTTAVQGSLLPFHANLFEAAIEAKVPVQPYALRYLDVQGALHPAADFVGEMTIVESIVTILKARSMTVELLLLPLISTAGAHRRELAVVARQAIANGLGHIGEDVSQVAALEGNLPETAHDPQAALR